MDNVKVYNAGDNFEADRIVELLKVNDIDCYIMESGSGGYLTIQQGFSIYGKDIYVSSEDKDEARKLIDEFINNKNVENQYENQDDLYENVENEYFEDKDEEYKVPWFRNRVIVSRIIIFGAIIIGFFVFISRFF